MKKLFSRLMSALMVVLLWGSGPFPHIVHADFNPDSYDPMSIVLEVTTTAPNQTVTINKYFNVADYTIDRGDSSSETISTSLTHTYTDAGVYEVELQNPGDRWKFSSQYNPLVPQYETTASDVKIISMPSLADGFGEGASSPGNRFFGYFNSYGAITSLPDGSFDTSNITTVGDYFFFNFNSYGPLISLPENSFNTSNITTVGDYFFGSFNYDGSLTSLPDGSFDTSNMTTVGSNFFKNFNVNGSLTSLPIGSFDTSNITTVGDYFFGSFNAYGAITSLPEGSFDTSNMTTVGSNFFGGFSEGGSLTALPEGSFDISSITTVGSSFFYGFNFQGTLTSLPEGSFDTSNITSVGDGFFGRFNYYGSLTSLPIGSFDTSNITTVGSYFFESFNNGGTLTKGSEGIEIKNISPSNVTFYYNDGGTNQSEFVSPGNYFDSYTMSVSGSGDDEGSGGSYDPMSIVLEVTTTAPNQTIKINKYFNVANYVIDWGDGSSETISTSLTHTYPNAGIYYVELQNPGGRWKFSYQFDPLVPQFGTTASDVKIVSMPSLVDGFGESGSNPGGYFFYSFNNGGALTSLPEGSFDTSNITKVGVFFFGGFNGFGALTSLPENSFNTSNITTAGDNFFGSFNNNGAFTSLPVGSFNTSNITTVGYSFFRSFNYNGALTSLPDGSFDTSNITTVGDTFFYDFNYNGVLTSLPENSFDTSNITSAGGSFFGSFNNNGALTSLPEGSFDTSNITTVGEFFFDKFNYNGALTRGSPGSGVPIYNAYIYNISFYYNDQGTSQSASINPGQSFEYYSTVDTHGVSYVYHPHLNNISRTDSNSSGGMIGMHTIQFTTTKDLSYTPDTQFDRDQGIGSTINLYLEFPEYASYFLSEDNEELLDNITITIGSESFHPQGGDGYNYANITLCNDNSSYPCTGDGVTSYTIPANTQITITLDNIQDPFDEGEYRWDSGNNNLSLALYEMDGDDLDTITLDSSLSYIGSHHPYLNDVSWTDSNSYAGQVGTHTIQFTTTKDINYTPDTVFNPFGGEGSFLAMVMEFPGNDNFSIISDDPDDVSNNISITIGDYTYHPSLAVNQQGQIIATLCNNDSDYPCSDDGVTSYTIPANTQITITLDNIQDPFDEGDYYWNNMFSLELIMTSSEGEYVLDTVLLNNPLSYITYTELLDIDFSLSADKSSFYSGDSVRYTLAITNNEDDLDISQSQLVSAFIPSDLGINFDDIDGAEFLNTMMGGNNPEWASALDPGILALYNTRGQLLTGLTATLDGVPLYVVSFPDEEFSGVTDYIITDAPFDPESPTSINFGLACKAAFNPLIIPDDYEDNIHNGFICSQRVPSSVLSSGSTLSLSFDIVFNPVQLVDGENLTMLGTFFMINTSNPDHMLINKKPFSTTTSQYLGDYVLDNEAPVVTLNGSGDITLNVGDSYTELGAIWTDDNDGSGSIDIPTTGSVDTSVAGDYILSYSYTDQAGNTGSATRTVRVQAKQEASGGGGYALVTPPSNEKKKDTPNDKKDNLSGSTTFKPEEIRVLPVEKLRNPTVGSDPVVVGSISSSIDDSAVLSNSVQFLYSYGMTSKDSVASFYADYAITREQAAKFLVQFAQNVLKRDKIREYHDRYTDLDKADPTLVENIKLAYKYGIMNGKNNDLSDDIRTEFSPQERVSIDELKTSMVRLVLNTTLDEPREDRSANYRKVFDQYNANQLASNERGQVAQALYNLYRNNEYTLQKVGYVIQ